MTPTNYTDILAMALCCVMSSGKSLNTTITPGTLLGALRVIPND